MQLKSSKVNIVNILIVVLGIVAIVSGSYDLFFRTSGYIKTTAKVVFVEETEGVEEDDTDYIVIVEYEANGQRYTEELDSFTKDKYSEGDTIEVLYDGNDPTKVRTDEKGIGLYEVAIGILLLGGGLITVLKRKRAMAQLQEANPEGTVYAPAVRGEERHLYFLTDANTAKYGHRIEDEDRNVLYEAKVTKFTLTAPTGFDFIDHEHGTTTPHLIGHEEATEFDTLLIDSRYTFTFDGEDIWHHLKRNGISIESGFMDGKMMWPQYNIYRDGEEYALVQCSSYHVHEEDEAASGKLGNLLPAQGFYRIWTEEKNLDLLFVTILAFARTGANDGNGGSYGLLLHNKD